MSEFISVEIRKSVQPKKRFVAIFKLENGKTKKVNFGSEGAYTYIDGADNKVKENYLKRHKVRENWDDPITAGALSRWVLWGEHRNVNKNIRDYKRKFGLN